MRLKKTEVAEREAFVLAAFKGQPGVTGLAVNAALFEKTGSKMRAKRLYDLKKIAEGKVPASKIPASAETPVVAESSAAVA